MKRILFLGAGCLLLVLGTAATGLWAVAQDRQQGHRPWRQTSQKRSRPTVRASTRTAARPVETQSVSGQLTAPPALGDDSTSIAPAPQQPEELETLQIRLKNGPGLKGQAIGLKSLDFQAVFGRVSLPLNVIAGLRVTDDETPVHVVLRNGDTLSGKLLNPHIQIRTAWGMARVSAKHLQSLTTTEVPQVWLQHDGRWNLAPARDEKTEDSSAVGPDLGGVPSEPIPSEASGPPVDQAVEVITPND